MIRPEPLRPPRIGLMPGLLVHFGDVLMRATPLRLRVPQ